MSIEQQLLYTSEHQLTDAGNNARQRLTISNRLVSTLSFRLRRAAAGSSGSVYIARIIRVSDSAVLAETASLGSQGISTSVTWYDFSLVTPTIIDDEVWISIQKTGSSIYNDWFVSYQNTDVKASEYLYLNSNAYLTYDLAYKYNYVGSTTEGVVTTQAVTAIAATTATANATVTGLGLPEATQHGFIYAIYPNPITAPGAMVTTEGVPTAVPYTSSLTGLLPNTKYYIIPYIYGAWGTAYGTEVEFTTLGNEPSVSIQTTTAIAATTATGNGNVLALGSPAATQYGHCWDIHPYLPTVTDSGSGFWGKTSKGVPGATGAYTSSLTGLLQNTAYYVRAYITDSYGVTHYSSQKANFTTLAGIPLVTTGLATEITETTALGNGSIDNNGGSSITQHGICWSISANPTIALITRTEEGVGVVGDFSSLMGVLAPNTLYYYRTYATNSVGTGYGADQTFSTNITGVPTVTTQNPSNVQETTATGNGNIVSIGGSAVTQHGVVWSTSPSPTIASHVGGDLTTDGAAIAGAFTSAITVLIKNTTYYYRAYATNTQGTGYGNDISFKTGFNYPNITTNATARVTNIIHRYNRDIYNLEMNLGSLTTEFALPEIDTGSQKSYQSKEAQTSSTDELQKLLTKALNTVSASERRAIYEKVLLLNLREY